MRTAMDNFKIDDFERFSHACKYGVGGGWPRETILIWQADNGAWQLERGGEGSGGHAEKNMLDKLKGKEIKELIMFVSYSPCSGCCEKLMEFMSEEKKTGPTINIYFSCFYNVYRPNNSGDKANWSGLKKLYNTPGIKLDLLNNGPPSTWEKLLKVIGGENEGKYRAQIEKDVRRRREDWDRYIMNQLRSGGNMINPNEHECVVEMFAKMNIK